LLPETIPESPSDRPRPVQDMIPDRQ